MMFTPRTYDYKKEHKELDREGGRVFCSYCGKTLEEREKLPDYSMFMGSVWIKQNLPCKPYEPPQEVEGKEKTRSYYDAIPYNKRREEVEE